MSRRRDEDTDRRTLESLSAYLHAHGIPDMILPNALRK